jgi:hypothetical protein
MRIATQGKLVAIETDAPLEALEAIEASTHSDAKMLQSHFKSEIAQRVEWLGTTGGNAA